MPASVIQYFIKRDCRRAGEAGPAAPANRLFTVRTENGLMLERDPLTPAAFLDTMFSGFEDGTAVEVTVRKLDRPVAGLRPRPDLIEDDAEAGDPLDGNHPGWTPIDDDVPFGRWFRLWSHSEGVYAGKRLSVPWAPRSGMWADEDGHERHPSHYRPIDPPVEDDVPGPRQILTSAERQEFHALRKAAEDLAAGLGRWMQGHLDSAFTPEGAISSSEIIRRTDTPEIREAISDKPGRGA